MKHLTCEMCGETDLIKQNGVYVCLSCGTKYSVEEARKMMTDGTVDVSGSTVQIGTSTELANLYMIARRAKNDENSENATKYYDMILQKDPTSWEASFYVVYYRAASCRIADILSAAISVRNCQGSVLGLIRGHVPKEKQASAVKEVVDRSQLIAIALADGAKHHYNGIDSSIKQNYKQEYLDRVGAARDILYTCGTQVDRIFNDTKEIAAYAADAWKAGITLHRRMLTHLVFTSEHESVILDYSRKIGKYDRAYLQAILDKAEKERILAQKEYLRGEIEKLQTEINTAGSASAKEGCLVWFLILIGLLFLFSGIGFDGDGFLIFMGSLFLGLGLWLGFLFLKNKPKADEEESQRIAAANNKLKQLQDQLDALNRK